MDLQKNVRVSPSVRLTFSRGGVSTTVAAQEEDATSGALLNARPPAARFYARSPTTERLPAPQASRGVWPPRFSVVEPFEPDAEDITTPGLHELGALLQDVQERRLDAVSEVAQLRATLARAQARLRFAQTFIVRLFTVDALQELGREVDAAALALAIGEADLAACSVDVDFGFDHLTTASYKGLAAAFEALADCDAVWDATVESRPTRGKERAAAAESFSRTRVRIGFSTWELVKCRYPVGKMEAASGRSIFLYPGFLVVGDTASEFDLLEYDQLELSLSKSEFIEEEDVPADAEAWEDPDNERPRDASPIVLYGVLGMRAPIGLNQTYIVSSYARAVDFVLALEAHKDALIVLQAQPSGSSGALDSGPEPSTPGRRIRRPTPVRIVPHSFIPDLATLALLIVAMAWAVWSYTPAPTPSPPSAQVITPAAKTVHNKSPKVPVRKATLNKPTPRRAPVAVDRSAEGPEPSRSSHCDKVRATINPDAVSCN